MRQFDAQASDASNLRTLWDAATRAQGIVLYDREGIILDVNPVFLGYLGYTAEDLVGQNHAIFGAQPGAEWARLSDGGTHCLQRLAHTGKAGKVSWLQSTFCPVPGSDGAVSRILQTATDVTVAVLADLANVSSLQAIENSHAVIVFDLAGLILDANEAFLEAVGYDLAEIVGRHHRMFVTPGEAESEQYRAFWNTLAAGRHQAGEFKRTGKHGAEIWLQATYNPVLDPGGQPFHIVKYATVITEQKLRQADLQGQMTAIDKSQCLISFDLTGAIISANANFCALVGYSAEELVGQNHRMLVDPALAASDEYAAFWDTLCAGEFVSGLHRRIGKHGQVLWIQASYTPILDLNGKPSRIVKFATNVTGNIELAAAYEDAKRQSQHDPGTALPNRVRLLDFMNAILVQPDAQLSVLYLDLDRFKPINDGFGHEAGDFVLAQIAERLRRTLGMDQLAARIGGDEFVIAAPNLSAAAIEDLCIRVIETISEPVRHGGHELRVGVSIGVATSADSRQPDELLRCADVAMYRSKQDGRGIFSFYAAPLNDRLVAATGLSEELQRGLANGEFFLDYQPRFDTATDAIVSVEALIRWKHPQRGLVPPLDFIPHAERSGLIARLGEWVLREACRAAMAWPGIGISVNVSPVQFQAGTLVDIVASALRDTGLEPGRLELELTESVVIGDTEMARTTLDSLKRLGIRIAMDDFGTGYASLSNLRALPFDAIKIDRQFIRDMDTRDGGREVVQAILALAQALGLRVTAEGVETANQLSMLTTDHCSELQGFLLARPMPPAQVTALLDRGHGALAQAAPRRRSAVRRTLRESGRLARGTS